jgi:hypothetical protein
VMTAHPYGSSSCREGGHWWVAHGLALNRSGTAERWRQVLISAFCIIIIVTYRISFDCYLPSYIVIFAFLVDFQDFPTKFPSLVFNSWRQKISFFVFYLFQDFRDR